MAEVIQMLEQNGLREQVKIIIGGAPVSEEFARGIGADGYGADGFQAVAVVDALASNTEN
jgi:methanogenic corrinoid protein MtbC1